MTQLNVIFEPLRWVIHLSIAPLSELKQAPALGLRSFLRVTIYSYWSSHLRLAISLKERTEGRSGWIRPSHRSCVSTSLSTRKRNLIVKDHALRDQLSNSAIMWSPRLEVSERTPSITPLSNPAYFYLRTHRTPTVNSRPIVLLSHSYIVIQEPNW